MWQADITAWTLADGEVAEVLNLIDDHSRLFLGSIAYGRVKALDVVESFHKAAELHGLPASLLSDNGAVFTGTSRGGKVLLQYELERLGVEFKNSRPYHPQTCGKVERLHQTLKRYLAKQAPAQTLSELQEQLDAFAHYYNAVRPHRALGGRTPLQAYSARVKARPVGASTKAYFRVRSDRVDDTGKVSLRFDSRLYKIGLGRTYKGRAVKLADRRSGHPRDRLKRRVDSRAHARPHPHLPAARKGLGCPVSPETCVRDQPETSQSGGGGIRTLVGGISPETVFETAAFNRSATPPGERSKAR